MSVVSVDSFWLPAWSSIVIEKGITPSWFVLDNVWVIFFRLLSDSVICVPNIVIDEIFEDASSVVYFNVTLSPIFALWLLSLFEEMILNVLKFGGTVSITNSLIWSLNELFLVYLD